MPILIQPIRIKRRKMKNRLPITQRPAMEVHRRRAPLGNDPPQRRTTTAIPRPVMIILRKKLRRCASMFDPLHSAPVDGTCSRVKTCKDLYEILGVSKTASEADLKKAYRKLALQVKDEDWPRCCSLLTSSFIPTNAKHRAPQTLSKVNVCCSLDVVNFVFV